MATRLIDSNHYASISIQQVAAQLDHAWKEFASGLDERTTVLALSVHFHQRAEGVRFTSTPPNISSYSTFSQIMGQFHSCYIFQYVTTVPSWNDECVATDVPNGVTELEEAIHHHQNLYEAMCQAYTEVRFSTHYFLILWCLHCHLNYSSQTTLVFISHRKVSISKIFWVI